MSAMIVSFDIYDINDIHPKGKFKRHE